MEYQVSELPIRDELFHNFGSSNRSSNYVWWNHLYLSFETPSMVFEMSVVAVLCSWFPAWSQSYHRCSVEGNKATAYAWDTDNNLEVIVICLTIYVLDKPIASEEKAMTINLSRHSLFQEWRCPVNPIAYSVLASSCLM